MARRARVKPETNGHTTDASLVASGARIDLTNKKEVEFYLARHLDWQAEGWGYYDAVGEAKYGINFLAGQLGKVRLFPARPRRGEPPEPIDHPAAQAAIDKLADGMGMHTQLLFDLAVNLEVPGECNLLVLDEPLEDRSGITVPAGATIRSTDEIVRSEMSGVALQVAPGGPKIALDEERDLIARIWTSHPRWKHMPDSPMHGVLSVCEEILILERSIRASGKSRLNAGLLGLSNSMVGVSPGPDQEGKQPPRLVDQLIEAASTAIQQEGSASALVPLIVRGEREDLAAMKHLVLSRPIDAETLNRLEALIRRLAQSMNIPVEIITGAGGVNHWSAWQIDESVVKNHVDPLAGIACQALTLAWLWPTIGQSDVVIWFDSSHLAARPNKTAEGFQAHQALVISDEALRKTTGFTDADAPSDDELTRRMTLNKGSLDPVLTEQILERLLTLHLGPASPTPGPAAPGGASPPAVEPIPMQGPPPMEQPSPSAPAPASIVAAGTDIGRALAEIDRALGQRLLAACDAAARRAAEKLGSAVRQRAKRDKVLSATIKEIPHQAVPQLVGQSIIAALGLAEREIIEPIVDGLRGRWDSWVAAAQTRAMRIAGLPKTSLDRLASRFVDDRAAGWLILREGLISAIESALYGGPEIPAKGEWDSSVLIPYGVVRKAMSRAGGNGGGLVAAGWLLAPGGVMAAVSGVAVGPDVLQALSDEGGGVQGYRWVYGAFERTHPFEPHQALDGVEFTGPDDPAIANLSGDFPYEPYFYGGDHDGCLCDWEPIILAVGETAAPEGEIPVDEAAAEAAVLAELRSQIDDWLAKGDPVAAQAVLDTADLPDEIADELAQVIKKAKTRS